tara:strand:- start:246 stop:1568 length:1323 start_codon:yes stop_codon:yes gene_type:complete
MASTLIGWKGQVAGKMLGVGTQLESASVVAWMLRKSIREWGNKDAKHRVLCIQRSIFEEDVRAMAERTDDVCFGMLPKAKLHDIFRQFVDRHPQARELTEYNYHHGCCREALEAYGTFMEKVLSILGNHWPFDAVLSGNFGYLQQQEVARIVENRGIPFITLFKEGLVIPAYLDELPKKVIDRKRYIGSKIIFYSEQIRDAVLKSDAFDGAEFEVAVSGIPRMDRLVGAPAAKKKRMVLFSFYPEDKFRCFDSSPDTLKRACDAADGFHRIIYRFAKDNPDWELVVKTKVGERYLTYARDLLVAECGEVLANVQVTNAGAAVDLIEEARVVVAFQSTTGIEALVAGRTVICPDFGEFFGDEPWDYFQDHPELVTYAKSLTDIEQAVRGSGENVEKQGPAPQRRDEFLQKMVHGADGKASERVIEAIVASIESRKQNREGA